MENNKGTFRESCTECNDDWKKLPMTSDEAVYLCKTWSSKQPMTHARRNYIRRPAPNARGHRRCKMEHERSDNEKEQEDVVKPVVLVTGCSQGGIGYEYCKAFADLNCQVIPTELPCLLPNTTEGKGRFHEWIPLDVSSDASVSEAVSHVIAAHGRIDVVINNAGVGGTGPLAEIDLASVRRAWEVNALGQLRLAQAVAPHMAARRHGRIVNVGSVVGDVPTPWAGPYCASKAASHALTDALRVELRPFGVHVVKVVPGAVRSGIGKHNMEGLDGKEWRMYGEFKAAIAERANASQTGKATDAAVFAWHVAQRVLRPRPPRQIVFGNMTGLFAVLAWSPLWARDLFFSRRFGLDKTM